MVKNWISRERRREYSSNRIYIKTKISNGRAGHRSQDLSHAERALYHWATRPGDNVAPCAVIEKKVIRRGAYMEDLNPGTVKKERKRDWTSTKPSSFCTLATALQVITMRVFHMLTKCHCNYPERTPYLTLANFLTEKKESPLAITDVGRVSEIPS